MTQEDIYLKAVLFETGRLISLLDRNVASATYGCFDRNYWSWRIGDMPNASLQYGVYPLTWLWKNDPTGIYCQNEVLLEWIIASIHFWLKIQNKNGSFNQFFPNEQSVGTTYYTLSAVLYAYDTLEDHLERTFLFQLETSINRAAEFVLKNDEDYAVISNHLALYGYVLFILHKHCKDDRFQAKGWACLETIFKHQSTEGWFLEYEGADPGYQSQCSYYLALCYQLTGESRILEKIKESVSKFLVYFFHPDGSFGGEYGCRNTEILYPAGFEILKCQIPECQTIMQFIRQGIQKGRLLTPNCLDDENSIRLATNYLLASQYSETNTAETFTQGYSLPCYSKQDTKVHFPNAGILIRGNAQYYLILNYKKGGVIKIFNQTTKRLIHEDLGYFLNVDNTVITTQIFQEVIPELTDDSISFSIEFFEVLNAMLNPQTNIILRILAVTLFRVTRITDLFRKILVNRAFVGKKKYMVNLSRNLHFQSETITIIDTVSKAGNIHIKKIVQGRKAHAVKMASANYHLGQDLCNYWPRELDLKKLNRFNTAEITTHISMK